VWHLDTFCAGRMRPGAGSSTIIIISRALAFRRGRHSSYFSKDSLDFFCLAVDFRGSLQRVWVKRSAKVEVLHSKVLREMRT